MAVDIDSLQIEIEATSSDAASKIDQLATALTNLKSAAKGGAGLTTTTKQLQALSNAAKLINGTNLNSQKIQQFASAMNSLSTIQKASGLNSTINALKKLPEISAALNKADLGKFAQQMNQVAAAMRPLATEMQKVANGFSAFPIRIQKIIQSNSALAASNNKTAKSFGVLGTGISSTVAKLGVYYLAFQRIANVVSGWIKSANDYIENVNLFQVSMGEFYDEAFAYAQLVSDRLGIDPSEWMRNQGVFMSMANGFGLAREQAYALSEGLTELSYDLSSLYNEDVEQSALRLQSALSGEIEPIRRLGISISQATLQEYALAHGIEESVTAMTEQEKALLRSLVLMEGAARVGAIGDFAKTLESPANAMRVLRQQVQQLAVALGTVLLPIIVQILPWVQAFVEIITEAIRALATLVGFTMPEWDTNDWGSGISSGADLAAESMDDATKSAKALAKATIGIDELNIISPQANTGADAGIGTSGWAQDLEIPNIWDKQAISEIRAKADAIKSMIQDNLAEITAIVSGFSLAVGAILTLTGANIPLGVALMAVGAAGLISTMALNWGSMDSSLRGILATITGMLGGFFLALGAILAFSGANVPVGIALMVVGAASLVSAVAINWGGMGEAISGALSTISGIVGGALLAVGAVLAFSGGNIPLGIAMMAVGAVTVASAVALNWSSINPEIQGAVSRITAIVSGGMLALGAILAFTGVNTALGIALIAAGAATLATTAAINWESMTPELSKSLTTITTLVGGSFLALGAVLAFSGANIPLGIGLILVGATGLATAAALNWDFITATITQTLKDIGAIVGVSLLALGAILVLTGVALPLGIGMLVAGGVTLASSVALNWNFITYKVSSILSSIGDAFQSFVDKWLSFDTWVELGKNAIDGLFSGLSNIWGTVSSWGKGLLNDVKNVLGIHSPSTEFEAIGEYSVAGLEQGFSKLPMVSNTFSEQIGIMKTSAKAFSDGLYIMIDTTLAFFLASILTAQTENQGFTNAMTTMYKTMAIQSNSAIQSIISSLNSIPRSITTVHTIVTRNVSSGGSSKAYASGGFPETGQMFIAREAGPELVGTIGNRTAVANNAQIVAGIASGVAEANQAQNALLREQNDLLRAILAKEGVTYISDKQIKRAYDRATRTSGASIMSGGVVG